MLLLIAKNNETKLCKEKDKDASLHQTIHHVQHQKCFKSKSKMISFGCGIWVHGNGIEIGAIPK